MSARNQSPVDDGGPGEVLFEHSKPNGNLLRVAKRTYRGSRPFLDLREWADHGRVATKHGVTVPLEALPALMEALAAHKPINPPGNA